MEESMGVFYNEEVKKHNLYLEWSDTRKEAYLYDKLDNNSVKCRLCPRRCVINPDNVGFCKVRKNIGGVLYAQSYGKATHLTIEKIETEAVFNYSPGAKILSLGNFGCNLNCDYCQNWAYSQFEYTPPEFIHEYSSNQIIDYAVKENIAILSWTYNDPAVWFEFVVDTAKEAKKRGLKNLFKSAFFLTSEAVEILAGVIDVFAVSIKAMDEDYYKKFTKGWLKPVLENVKLIYGKGKYFEISNLVVTGITNNDESYLKMIDFVKNELSASIPLHFTRFHPDYKYMDHLKTPVEDVMRARQKALEAGLAYCYVGNTFNNGGLNTYCPNCKVLLIERYGLCTYIKETLSMNGTCNNCGSQTRIQFISEADERKYLSTELKSFKHTWNNLEEFLLHIQVTNPDRIDSNVIITRFYQQKKLNYEPLTIDRNTDSYRFILSRTHTDEIGFEICYSEKLVIEVFTIDDRAFYPSESFYKE
jgi:pyruvate formate lyase activating enzyme